MPDGLEGGERRQNTMGALGGIWQALTKRERRQVFGWFIGPMSLIVAALFWSGYYFYQFDREYKPLPTQVERLAEHASHAEREIFPQVDSLAVTVENMGSDLQTANSDRREIIVRLDNLDRKLDNIGCFVEAEAGIRSHLECRE